MYRTRKRDEEDTNASEIGKKLTLRLLALHVFQREHGEDVSGMPGNGVRRINREIKQGCRINIRGVV